MNNFIKYDCIYIGSGPVMMLDALNKSLQNKKVLLIDKSNKLGGAWKTIDIFGEKDLENAVHYLMPNNSGYEFLLRFLKIDLIKSEDKYYAFQFLNIRMLLPVDNIFSKILFNLFYKRGANFLNKIISTFKNSNHQHKYPRKGSKEIIDNIKKLFLDSNVKILINTDIDYLNINSNKAEIFSSKGNFLSDKLIISHGFVPPKSFYINSKTINLTLKHYLRPSLHIRSDFCRKMLNNKKKLRQFSQVLFPEGSLVKYVHYLNKFLDTKNSISKDSNHYVVAALKHNLKYSHENCLKVAKELEDYKLIPILKREKQDFFWQDIHLPLLVDEDLVYLKEKSNNIIEPMFTDELSSSIGNYQKEWDILKKILIKKEFNHNQ